MYSSHSRRRGFTLIELLVVVAIVAVLAAILFPIFAHRHGESPGGRCRINLKQLTNSLQMYATDYDNRFPPHGYAVGAGSTTLPALLHPYLKNREVWQCPTAATNGDRASSYDGSADDATVSYGYNWSALTRNGSGVALSQVHDPAETIALVDTTSYLAAPLPLIPALGGTPPSYRHYKSAVVAWVDGHIKAERPGKLEAIATEEGGKRTGNGIDQYRYWNLR